MICLVILGIDPGLATMGYGVIESDGIKHKLIQYGVLTTLPNEPMPQRLRAIFKGVNQLMDIYKFDQAKFDALKDLITVGPSDPYPLWTLPEEELAKHPYLDRHSAHAIVIFRKHNSTALWTVESLARAGILSPAAAAKLSRCRVAEPRIN